jgi:hypothetical protein
MVAPVRPDCDPKARGACRRCAVGPLRPPVRHPGRHAPGNHHSGRPVRDHPAVGYFGTFIYRDGEWRDRGGGDRELVLDIHDSDIATIDYRPAPPGLGRFYLGVQPRDYFADPEASRPVDVPAEVEGFRQWARQVLGTAPPHDDVRELVAEQDAAQQDGTGQDGARQDGGGPGEDFVEDAAARLIHLLGLPLPPALAEVTQ